MASRTHSPAPRRLRRVAGHAFGMAAVVAIVLVGNLRVQSSESRASGPVAEAAFAMDPEARTDSRLSVASHESGGDEPTDAVEVVPAIYAWNPDVRFVYFRHVSKWM